MNIQQNLDPFPHVIIKNYFDEFELKVIWEELEFICYPQKLEPPDITGTARDNGRNLKQNRGVWLNDVYRNHLTSSILSVNRKLFNSADIIYKNHPHWYFHHNTTAYSTLLSYYENSDYYESHKDQAYLTCLSWFYKEPKKFSGGDLYFPDYEDYTIEYDNNKGILFPSGTKHAVTPIKMQPDDCGKKLGRFCMSQFLSIEGENRLNMDSDDTRGRVND